MFWIVIIITAVLVWASADIDSGVYIKTLCRKKTDRKIAALSFDDGPAGQTALVLDVLKKHGVKAVFFLIGSKINGQEDIVRRIVAEGHIIGTHSWSHKAGFPLYSSEKIQEEMVWTAEKITKITGLRPRLFRPPFGVTNPAIASAVKALNLTPIGWNIRSLDTNSWVSREDIKRRVMSRLRPGSLILLHDRCEGADRLLDSLLTDMKQDGYEIVSVEELFDIKAYEE